MRLQPFCVCPHHKGKDRTAKSEVVDHIEPHRGDTRLFFNPSNLQALAKQCHDKFKQSLEKGGRGFDQGCDVNGEPLNEDAAWYVA